jgi:hypothetical protein
LARCKLSRRKSKTLKKRLRNAAQVRDQRTKIVKKRNKRRQRKGT